MPSVFGCIPCVSRCGNVPFSFYIELDCHSLITTIVVINIIPQASYNISLLLAVVSTARLFMSLPLVFPPTTAPVTKSGDTMFGLAVREGQLDIIKYLVTECSASVSGEQSVC